MLSHSSRTALPSTHPSQIKRSLAQPKLSHTHVCIISHPQRHARIPVLNCSPITHNRRNKKSDSVSKDKQRLLHTLQQFPNQSPTLFPFGTPG
ncbi:unnamed protein product [Periconia digitata]|uniref:Uncharacterized protein n=1 Tax=Periconia digitata TaxID=1303443 RepID=A0A9W4XN29_9PLEO|nr:unnamed protein product [Periconia digitata]